MRILQPCEHEQDALAIFKELKNEAVADLDRVESEPMVAFFFGARV